MAVELSYDDYMALHYIISDGQRIAYYTTRGCYVHLADAGYIETNDRGATWVTAAGIEAYHRWRDQQRGHKGT
jgi:hypothetical protein